MCLSYPAPNSVSCGLEGLVLSKHICTHLVAGDGNRDGKKDWFLARPGVSADGPGDWKWGYLRGGSQGDTLLPGGFDSA